MIRRPSLAPISESAINTRQGRPSFAPSDHTKTRMSLGPGVGMNATKRNSFAPPPRKSIANPLRSNDPKNANLINNNLKILSEFLEEKKFEGPVTTKALSKLSNKDFQNIILFLFQQIDPQFTFVSKIEEEVVTMFKFLGYPYGISKSQVMSAGTAHALPVLVAALVWLIELINYDQLSTNHANGLFHAGNIENLSENFSEKQQDERNFNNYLTKAYTYFISGRDDHYLKLQEKFVNSFDQRTMMLKDQIDVLERKNASFNDEIERIKRRGAYLPELENKKKILENENFLIIQKLDEKSNTKKNMKAVIERNAENLTKSKQAINNATKEIAVLNDKILQQEISVEDIENMKKEKFKLEEARRQTSEFRQAMNDRIWELEVILRDEVQALEDTVRSYHAIAESLKLVPQSAKNSRGENLVIEIDIYAKKKENLLKSPINGKIIPILNELKKELVDKTLILRSETLAEQEKVDEIELKISELEAQCQELQKQKAKVENSFKNEKESIMKSWEIKSKNIEELENTLIKMRDTTQEERKLNNLNTKIKELSLIKTNKINEYERKKSALINSIMDIITQCASHREMVQMNLNKLKNVYSNRYSLLFDSLNNSMSNDSIILKLLDHQNKFNLKDLVSLCDSSDEIIDENKDDEREEAIQYHQSFVSVNEEELAKYEAEDLSLVNRLHDFDENTNEVSYFYSYFSFSFLFLT